MTMLLRTFVIAAAVAAFLDMAMAANYVVGGPNGGWDMNTQLQSWSNSQTFVVGDTLTFNYDASHSLLQVSKPDYDACLTNGSFASYSGGNTVVPLSSSGDRYYICGSSGHCDRGMKVVIKVIAAASAPSPAAAPSIPAPATPSGSPTSSPKGSPVASPPKSAAAPTKSPKMSPSMSPSKAPISSPSESPAISAASPTSAPVADSPASASTPDASSPSSSNPPPPSGANKVNVIAGFTVTVGFIIMMLLAL